MEIVLVLTGFLLVSAVTVIAVDARAQAHAAKAPAKLRTERRCPNCNAIVK